MAGDTNSIILQLNVPVLAPSAIWPSVAQPSSQGPILRGNQNQITDMVRVLITAPYACTVNIQAGATPGSLSTVSGGSFSVTGGVPLDTGWVAVTSKYFQVQIVNGATQQGGDIYSGWQQTNSSPIQAWLCMFMQEPATTAAIGTPGLALPTQIEAVGGTDGINLRTLQMLPAGSGDGISGSGYGLQTAPMMMVYDGSNAWDRLRYGNKHNYLDAVTNGSNTIWTPGAGKKFRITGILLVCGAVATNVYWTDGGTIVSPTYYLTANQALYYDGLFARYNGLLSAAANNVLALVTNTTGPVQVSVTGTEE